MGPPKRADGVLVLKIPLFEDPKTLGSGMGTLGGPGFVSNARDGSVWSWGRADCGGDSSSVRDQLVDVHEAGARLESYGRLSKMVDNPFGCHSKGSQE